MLRTIRLLLFVGTFLYISNANAAISPISLGIVPPLQFPPSDFTIAGARLSLLYGQQRDVYGLDVGVIGNITEVAFVGVSVSGGFNYHKGMTTVLGLQLAGGANVTTQKTRVFGLQAAAGANYMTAESSVVGVQLALANLSDHTTIYGLQVGVYNRALAVYGFQVGLINDATNLHGVQIGLLNYNRTGTLLVSPIINVGF
ncbi:MAG: hypothetical protein KF799_06875 [Bdellovibrionales bacterium]|nr:hypothetical protein [Bdellovibrionales bacterium]